MKEFYAAIIFAVSLLAVTVVVLVFKYGQQRAYTKALEEGTVATQSMAVSIEEQALKRAEIARRSAEQNLKKAQLAREMLEKSKAKNALTQKQIVAAMNAQLEREADARLAAEQASKELAAQKEELSKAIDKTRAELERLQKAKTPKLVPTSEIADLKKLLKEREAEIERLKKHQAELELLRQNAEAAQAKTEREIEARGGKVELPAQRRVISPNIRGGLLK